MNQTYPSPASLVAIIVASRRAGDRELERESRESLRERYGVKLQFTRGRQDLAEGDRREI